MLAAILIVIMIGLQTGVVLLDFNVGLGFIPEAASVNHKQTRAKYRTGNCPGGAGLGNKEVLYAFSSTRIGTDRRRCSPRAGQSLHTDGRID